MPSPGWQCLGHWMAPGLWCAYWGWWSPTTGWQAPPPTPLSTCHEPQHTLGPHCCCCSVPLPPVWVALKAGVSRNHPSPNTSLLVAFYTVPNSQAFQRGLRNPPWGLYCPCPGCHAPSFWPDTSPCLSALFGRDKPPRLRCQGGGSHCSTSHMAACTGLAGAGLGWTDCMACVLASLVLDYICNASARGFRFTHGPAKNLVLKAQACQVSTEAD